MYVKPNEESQVSQFWTFVIGIALAFVSGLIFTANNYVIQTFSLDFSETLLVRSIIQILVIGLILLIKKDSIWPYVGPRPSRVRALIVFQGVMGGVMIMCAFSSVLFLPLGDAMTLLFSAPISTMIMAAIFLGHRLRLYKTICALMLFSGTILVIRPPFIFKEISSTASEDHHKLYFIGATIALSSAVVSSVINIAINFCQEVKPLVLLWWAGVGGLIVSLTTFSFDDHARMLGPEIVTIPYSNWLSFVLMAFAGICAYFCMTRSLQLIDPTIVAFVRALEIVFAYFVQVVFMQQAVTFLSVIGASFVMLSIFAMALQTKIVNFLPEKIKFLF